MDTKSNLKTIRWARAGVIFLIVLNPVISLGQDLPNDLSVSGNIYSASMYYLKDSITGSSDNSGSFRSNNYGNLCIRYRQFSVGIRYEAYLPPLLGYNDMYEGQGIPYRYASWGNSFVSATIGNFYEQFGGGLILRAFEDNDLGIDNSLDGIRLSVKPFKGVTLKGFTGKQRFYWDKGAGIVSGVDGEYNFSELSRKNSSASIIAGVGFVSRYQPDNDPLYKLPENVGAFDARFTYSNGSLFLNAEYAWKVNDPSVLNNMIYKNGQAFVFSSSYSLKGFGLQASGKWIDNMDFRSAREAVSNELTLSYIPVSFTQKTYSLPAMYPYPSQPLGEAAAQLQLDRKFPAGSLLGGKYGTNLTLIASAANEIKKIPLNDSTPVGTAGTKGYSSALFTIGEEKYYRDYSMEISKKITAIFKTVLGVSYVYYNKAIIEAHPEEDDVKAWIIWCDLSFKITRNNNLRVEAQNLNTHQDKGSWAMALMEYTISPNWSFTLTDQYNYGNNNKQNRIHYPRLDVTFTAGSQKISLSFGRQREGILCVGGVCRYVPLSTGLGFIYSITL
jgi:hypothetical protein